MSARYTFRLAGEADDRALRAVLRQAPMPGNISIAFAREPSFFIAGRTGNIRHQTLVCEDEETGRIVGVGGRSIRRAYVDGKPTNVGYLSSLRLLPEARGGTTLIRGYRHLRDLHSDGEVPYYFTTILEDNLAARSNLERGMAGMPTYVPRGAFVTYLIPLSLRRPVAGERRAVRAADLAHAHECLERWNERHQFAPVYALPELMSDDCLTALSMDNLYVCEGRHGTVGTLAVWDQSSFKQTIVTDYSAGMKAVKPLYNSIARMRGLPQLPATGSEIRSVHASLMSVDEDDPEIFGSLVRRACADWSGRGYDYLLLGLSERSSLGAVARRFAVRELRSLIYLVHWKDEGVELPSASRIPHLELATL